MTPKAPMMDPIAIPALAPLLRKLEVGMGLAVPEELDDEFEVAAESQEPNADWHPVPQ
jgi:hypothetical protein